MFVGERDEVNPLGPEELSEDIKSFVDVASAETEARRSVLAPRPIRKVWPNHAKPIPIDPDTSSFHWDDAHSVNDLPPITRRRHLIEFECGESSF